MTLKSDTRQGLLIDHHPDVFSYSEMAIQGIFVEVIRERFRGVNLRDNPHYWEADVTPKESEENSPDAPRKLYIESQYLEFPDARNYRPAVLVDTNGQTPEKQVVNNFAGRRAQDQKEAFWCPATTPVEILVVDDRRGSCSVLADIIWMHLLGVRNFVRAEFGFQDMTEPLKSKVQPFRRDKDLWEVLITFNVRSPIRWVTTPIAPLLRGIRLRLTTIGQGDPNQGAQDIAIGRSR